MKICLVSDNLVGYHEKWSGAELVVQYLASLLEKENQQVFILTVRSKKDKPANVFPVPALLGKFWSFKKIIPIHILIRSLAIFFLLKKIKPDIIHLFHANSLFLPTMLSARLLKIPTTFTVLDYNIICPTGHLRLKNGEICQEKEDWNCRKCVSLPKFLERKLERRLTKGLKTLITFTETSKKRLVAHGFSSEKIKVKYIYEFSFNAPMSKKENGVENNDILFIGTFFKQKGLHIVIEAMFYVREKIPDSKLRVIGRGEGQEKERIENLIESLNLQDAVEFLGQKKNDEALEVVSQSNLTVVAEQWFSDFGPVALVEAMAQAKPVVAGNIGSAPDFIEEGVNGFLAEYDNPKKFSEKIIFLLQNKQEAEKIGRNARETIKNFFGPNYNEEILELYAK